MSTLKEPLDYENKQTFPPRRLPLNASLKNSRPYILLLQFVAQQIFLHPLRFLRPLMIILSIFVFASKIKPPTRPSVCRSGRIRLVNISIITALWGEIYGHWHQNVWDYCVTKDRLGQAPVTSCPYAQRNMFLPYFQTQHLLREMNLLINERFQVCGSRRISVVLKDNNSNNLKRDVETLIKGKFWQTKACQPFCF